MIKNINNRDLFRCKSVLNYLLIKKSGNWKGSSGSLTVSFDVRVSSLVAHRRSSNRFGIHCPRRQTEKTAEGASTEAHGENGKTAGKYVSVSRNTIQS